MFKEKTYTMTDDKKAMIASLTLNNGRSVRWIAISEFEMGNDVTMLRTFDGHILYAPTKDVKIDVLPWENVQADGSNNKCHLTDEDNKFNMVSIEK